MIFGESPMKDLYRRLVWGPLRKGLEAGPLTWEIRGMRAVGRGSAAVLGGKRARLRENFARAFPELGSSELDRLARDAFAAHFSNQYLSFAFARCGTETWPRYLRFEGLPLLEAAQARGKGVVLVHPHMGPAQLPLHVLGLLGYPMHQVGGGRVTLVDLSPTGRWAAETRGRLEARMPVNLHDGKAYLRPVLRALQGGGIVMSAGDATGGGEEIGRRAPGLVLGQPMPLPLGPVWLALKSGAPLLSICCYRDPTGDRPPFVAEIGPELALQRGLPLREALAHGAGLLATWLDSTLRAHPGDWLFWDGFAPGGLLPMDVR